MADLSDQKHESQDSKLRRTFEDEILKRLKEMGVTYVEYAENQITFDHPSAGTCEIKFTVKGGTKNILKGT